MTLRDRIYMDAGQAAKTMENEIDEMLGAEAVRVVVRAP